MRRAGFRYVFLGIENVLDEDLAFLKAKAKNSRQQQGQRTNTSVAAVNLLRRHGMLVVGGLIVGAPDDRRESITANLAFARKYVDWPYIQHPTPYPGTPMTDDFVARNLIASPRVEEYDGTTAVIRTPHVDPLEIEFMRWQSRTLDEGAAHAEGARTRSVVRAAPRPPDARSHVPRDDVAVARRPRERPRRIRPLPRAPRPRARVCRLAGSDRHALDRDDRGIVRAPSDIVYGRMRHK